MSIPTWEPGKLYPPGSIVLPRTPLPSGGVIEIPNPSFETGTLEGWDSLFGAWYVTTERSAYDGTYLVATRTANEGFIASEAKAPVRPGDSVTASCYLEPSRGSDRGSVAVFWYDEVGVALPGEARQTYLPFEEQVRGTGGWRRSSITARAPAAARFAAIGAYARKYGNSYFGADAFSWTLSTPSPQQGLMYRAVQPATGYSDTTEPAWPGQLGEQVIDNEVVWEAISIARIVYEARPLLRSGDTEPTWPTHDGDRVQDGTISWEAVSRRVQDPNCPNSKVVAIAASKVFAADGDIIRFSATVNPTDWTSENNAGYLASGLQQANSNDMTVLNQYRGDLVAFNPNCFQNWQVDPDPELMALLDQMDGIGSSWQQAAQPVANDLIYLSQLGVRSVGRAAGTESLAAGDIGMPVDPLVQEAIAAALAGGIEPVSTYYPSAGQYWLAFPDYPDAGETLCFVVSLTGGSPKWSRYLFPFAIESFAQLGDDLYIRNGDQISIVSEEAATDEVRVAADVEGGYVSERLPFPGVVWWPWLDMGRPGVTKMMEGVDVVGSGSPSLSIGYDQRNITAFTAPYAIPADTVPGGIIPFPVSAPSISVRLDFAGGQKWSLQAVGLVLADTGGGP